MFRPDPSWTRLPLPSSARAIAPLFPPMTRSRRRGRRRGAQKEEAERKPLETQPLISRMVRTVKEVTDDAVVVMMV